MSLDLNSTIIDLIKAVNNASSIPVATSSALGGIKIGYTASGANLPVALSNEKAYVALTKSAVTSALGYTPLKDVDSALSATSKNPVQNKVIQAALEALRGQIGGSTFGKITSLSLISTPACDGGKDKYELPVLPLDESGFEYALTFDVDKFFFTMENPDAMVGTLSFSHNGVVIKEGITPSAKSEEVDISFNTTSVGESDHEFTLSGMDIYGNIVSKTVYVKIFKPFYMGSSATDTTSKELMESLPKYDKLNLSGTYTVTIGDGHYLWLFCPRTMVREGIKCGGLDVPMYIDGYIKWDNGGVMYEVLRSYYKLKAGTYYIDINFHEYAEES